MDLAEFIKQVPTFSILGTAERIRVFAYYLHEGRSMQYFAQADITNCFDSLGVARPGTIGPYLAKMRNRSPPEVLKDRHGYRLERNAREGLAERYGQRVSTVQVHSLLAGLAPRVAGEAERVFLEEALVCFRHGAFRSAVVMTWNLAYGHLCDHVLTHHLGAFNEQLPKTFPRGPLAEIRSRDDFTEFKESQVIQVCRSAAITTQSVDKILREKLARRNAAAHPSGVKITQTNAEDAIIDLIENVVLKL